MIRALQSTRRLKTTWSTRSVSRFQEVFSESYVVELIEEHSHYLKLRLNRLHATRLIFPWPQPTLEIHIDPEHGELKYTLILHDLWVFIAFACLFAFIWYAGGEFPESMLLLLAVVVVALVLEQRSTRRQVHNALLQLEGSGSGLPAS